MAMTRERDDLGPPDEEALYPMRLVTRLTGVPANTVRVWERRYKAVVPRRTDGNARRYSGRDVRKLQMLRDLTATGYRIRDVASRSNEELEALLGSGEQGQTTAGTPATQDTLAPEYARLRTNYMATIERLDVRRGFETLALAATMLSPSTFVHELVIPLVQETGRRWVTGTFSVAHEHVVSAQLRSLLPRMQQMSTPLASARRIFCAAPEGHLHEFGILIGAFMAASRGFDVVYLGPNMPEDDLLAAMQASASDLLLVSLPWEPPERELIAVQGALSRLAESVEVWVGCPADHRLVNQLAGARFFHRYEDLDAALLHLAGQQHSS